MPPRVPATGPVRRRPNNAIRSAVLGLALTTVGCSLAGSWRTVSLDPPGAPFPVDTITLDRDNNYTATWTWDGARRTTTGRYKWNGSTLEVAPPGSLPRKYGARLRADGKLVMTYMHGDAKLTATLERVDKP